MPPIKTFFISGGTEIGNFIKLPTIGKNIVADVDVERTLFDVKIVETSIKLKQGYLSIAPLGIFPSIIGTKKLFLKMSVDSDINCAEKEFEIEGRGIKSMKLSCKSQVGTHNVKIELFDTDGLEHTFQTTFTVS